MANKVEYRPAKDNPMFAPQMTALIRFAHYEKPVTCVHCGKKTRRHWTMLCPFTVPTEQAFQLVPSKIEHPPLTPVCTDHPFAPALSIQKAL